MRKNTFYRMLSGISVLVLILSCLVACGKESPSSSSDDISMLEGDFFEDLDSDTSTTSGSDAGEVSTTDASAGNSTTKTSAPSGDKVTTTAKKTTKPSMSKEEQVLNTEHAKNLPKLDVKNKTLNILRNAPVEQDDLLMEAYGIEMNTTVVESATLLTRFVSIAASDKCPDMFWYDFNSQLIAKKFVQPWDSYVDLKSDIWKGAVRDLDVWKVGGKHYYLFPESVNSGFVLYNKEIFDEYSVTYPSKLFEQNKWDWNAMQQLVEKLTIKKNGVTEIYGLFTNFGPYHWVASTGNEYVSIVSGTPKNLLKTANVERAIDAFVKLHKTGGYYYGSDELDAFLRGEVAMHAFITEGTLHNEKVLNGIKSGKYGFTATPKDPKSSTYYTCGTTAGYFLPKNSKNPEAAAAYMTVLRYKQSNAQFVKESRKVVIDKGTGYNQAMFDTLDQIAAKVTPTQDTWNHMGAEMLPVFTGIGQELINGKTWGQVKQLFSNTVDGIISNYMKQTS